MYYPSSAEYPTLYFKRRSLHCLLLVFQMKRECMANGKGLKAFPRNWSHAGTNTSEMRSAKVTTCRLQRVTETRYGFTSTKQTTVHASASWQLWRERLDALETTIPNYTVHTSAHFIHQVPELAQRENCLTIYYVITI